MPCSATSGAHWLRIPVGKLHNDRNVPLHPVLVDLIADYRARRGPSPSGLLVVRNDGQPFDRRTVHRYVAAVARRAGTGHVHPHQLRHTLATQLINRGMSLEAIAELLGHRSPRMTLVYARISNDSVAEQYFRATQAVEVAGNAPRCRRGGSSAGPESPSPVGQRTLHTTRSARLLLPDDLRGLRVLRDRTGVHSDPPSPEGQRSRTSRLREDAHLSKS